MAGKNPGALRDEEPLVRAHAAWALGKIGCDGARQALVASRRLETDADVLTEIDAALAAPDTHLEERDTP